MVIITYKEILKNSQVANSVLGMSLAEFEQLYAEFELAHAARQNTLRCTRRNRLGRKRTAGAGRKHKYSLCDRLLMTLFWLRAYTTYEVLGSLYNLDKTTIEDNIKSVLSTLVTMRTFQFNLPPPEVPKLRSVQEVMDAFPEIRSMIDAKESETHT